MSTAEIEVVEAFTSIGIAPEKAMAAAAALNRRDALADLSGFKSEILAAVSAVGKELSVVKSDVAVLKWMAGFTLAIVVALLLKDFVR
jgi:hypothetical protein